MKSIVSLIVAFLLVLALGTLLHDRWLGDHERQIKALSEKINSLPAPSKACQCKPQPPHECDPSLARRIAALEKRVKETSHDHWGKPK